jgi:hypothetical protein
MKVSFQVAKIWHTAKVSPLVFCGPRVFDGFTSYYAPSAPLATGFFLSNFLGS